MDQSPRTVAASRDGEQFRIGTHTLDADRGCVLRPDGTEITLRPKTAAVVLHLARATGRVVSRAELLDAVWPEIFVTDHSLTQCISELRVALGTDAPRLRTVAKRGYLLDAGSAAAGDSAPMASARATPPVLAVLPFANLSGEPRWDRLCDGLTEDMITDFARQSDLRVIARTSTLAWRNRPADIREIGRALNAHYLLEGSVQADAPRVAVTAQLIDADTGAHVWAGRYVREEEGLFAIQAEVIGRVVTAVAGLSGGLARAELARAQRAAPASLQAYELYLLAHEHEARLDRDGTLGGIPLLNQALAADPALSRAWTLLALSLGNAVANGWADDPDAWRARQQAAVRRAVALDPGDGLALEELGAMLARAGDLAGAADAFARAAEAGANHADTLALLGKYMVEVLGHAGTAERMAARAFALNPAAPPWYYLGATRVAFFTEDFTRAAELALRAPPLRLPLLLRALALAHAGDAASADAAVEQYRARFGPGGVVAALSSLPPLCPAAQLVLDAGLHKAGLNGGAGTPP